MTSNVMKAMKRLMAGEYSRELSAKVFTRQCRLIEKGLRQGGMAGYGLRRVPIVERGGRVRRCRRSRPAAKGAGDHRGAQPEAHRPGTARAAEGPARRGRRLVEPGHRRARTDALEQRLPKALRRPAARLPAGGLPAAESSRLPQRVPSDRRGEVHIASGRPTDSIAAILQPRPLSIKSVLIDCANDDRACGDADYQLRYGRCEHASKVLRSTVWRRLHPPMTSSASGARWS